MGVDGWMDGCCGGVVVVFGVWVRWMGFGRGWVLEWDRGFGIYRRVGWVLGVWDREGEEDGGG
jgi:hypothetical protein